MCLILIPRSAWTRSATQRSSLLLCASLLRRNDRPIARAGRNRSGMAKEFSTTSDVLRVTRLRSKHRPSVRWLRYGANQYICIQTWHFIEWAKGLMTEYLKDRHKVTSFVARRYGG